LTARRAQVERRDRSISLRAAAAEQLAASLPSLAAPAEAPSGIVSDPDTPVATAASDAASERAASIAPEPDIAGSQADKANRPAKRSRVT